MGKDYVVRPEKPIRLKDLPTGDTGPYKKKTHATKDLKKDLERLVELQELLYAEKKRSLLVVFQAMDTGGKDGAIKHVMGPINPQGCRVTSFKVPTPEELAHDFLWRAHKAVPAKGMIGIFNRSHYEDVLVVRVHKLVPHRVWKERYHQINEFERLLADTGTVILKFFLHISRKEQKERLQARLDEPAKHWKFSVGDLKERQRWDDYMKVYEDAVNRCSRKWAPWIVVPSDHKWYRNLVVARTVADTLEGLGMKYPEPEDDLTGIVIPD